MSDEVKPEEKPEVVSLGKCPVCKEGDIIEKEKNFACDKAAWSKGDEEGAKWENAGCQYSIYKQGLAKFGKPEITAEEVKTMLETGQVMVTLTNQKPMIPDDKYGIKVNFKG